MAGKATAAILSICIAGSGIYGVTQIAKQNIQQKTIQENTNPVTKEKTNEEQVPQLTDIVDADYPNLLIEESLTKEELEFILTYGQETLTEQGLTERDYLKHLPYISDC